MKYFLIISTILLQGCTLLVTTTGIGTTAGATVTTTSALEVAQALDAAKAVGDVASVQVTGKTLTDHIVSKLTGKDCRLFRKIKGEGDYCEPVEIVLPILNTENKIKVFQIIEGIRPVNGKMGPQTQQAYWQYEHGVKPWDTEFYMKFPRNDTQVMMFQRLYGIEQVPNVGPKTIKMLISYRDALVEN